MPSSSSKRVAKIIADWEQINGGDGGSVNPSSFRMDMMAQQAANPNSGIVSTPGYFAGGEFIATPGAINEKQQAHLDAGGKGPMTLPLKDGIGIDLYKARGEENPFAKLGDKQEPGMMEKMQKLAVMLGR